MPLSDTEPQTQTKRIKIGDAAEFPLGSTKVVVVEDQQIAVFNVEGRLYAIANRCPHRGASLGQGTRDGVVVTCPLHHWEFNLESGECVAQPGHGVRRFEVFTAGDGVLLDVSSTADKADQVWDGIHRYLVRYGAMGWAGRFGSVDRIECSHGDRVVVQTRRGVEIGEVLAGPVDGETGHVDGENHQPTGEVLRRLTSEDEQRCENTPQDDVSSMFDQCRALLSDRQVDVEVIDCERLFDGESIVIYFLGDESSQMQSIAEELGNQWRAKVLFAPVVEPAAAPHGSGGCSSGGCSGGGCGSE